MAPSTSETRVQMIPWSVAITALVAVVLVVCLVVLLLRQPNRAMTVSATAPGCSLHVSTSPMRAPAMAGPDRRRPSRRAADAAPVDDRGLTVVSGRPETPADEEALAELARRVAAVAATGHPGPPRCSSAATGPAGAGGRSG